MSKIKNKNFIIACDMDDVLMVPHTFIRFSEFLGIHDELSAPLGEYKSGRRTYESLWQSWNNSLAGFYFEDKNNAIKHVAAAIPETTYKFVEKSKELGKFIIVSNNDGDLVKEIAGKLAVEFIAVNKYIFEYKLITQKKSEAILKKYSSINAAITDDPVNEMDFLQLPAKNQGGIPSGIVLRKNDLTAAVYDKLPVNIKTAGTLEEVYENLLLIKQES